MHAGHHIFVYTCQHCRQRIVLSTHDDGADYWSSHDPGKG